MPGFLMQTAWNKRQEQIVRQYNFFWEKKSYVYCMDDCDDEELSLRRRRRRRYSNQ